MNISFAYVAKQMSGHTKDLSAPTGIFSIVVPATVSTPGHSFNLKETGPNTVYEYPGCLGSWFDETDPDPDGLGTVPSKSGACSIIHKDHWVDHAIIVAQVKSPGATLFWNNFPLQLDSLVEDTWQGATVVGFSLLSVRT